jgi:hypothetical protein
MVRLAPRSSWTLAFETPKLHQSLIDSSTFVNVGVLESYGMTVLEPQGLAKGRPCGKFPTTLAPSDREHEATLLFGPCSKGSAGHFSSRWRLSDADIDRGPDLLDLLVFAICPRPPHPGAFLLRSSTLDVALFVCI